MELGLSGPGIKLFGKAINSLSKVGARAKRAQQACAERSCRCRHAWRGQRPARARLCLHQAHSELTRRGAGSEVLVEAIAGDAVRAPPLRCATRLRATASARSRAAFASTSGTYRPGARVRSSSCAPSTSRARRISPCACVPTASTPSECVTWCKPPSTPRCALPARARRARHRLARADAAPCGSLRVAALSGHPAHGQGGHAHAAQPGQRVHAAQHRAAVLQVRCVAALRAPQGPCCVR